MKNARPTEAGAGSDEAKAAMDPVPMNAGNNRETKTHRTLTMP